MDIKIFKFGGASVNDAQGVRNVASILKKYPAEDILLVISAMGKTTNALEGLLRHYLDTDALAMVDSFNSIRDFHFKILSDLFPSSGEEEFREVKGLFEQLRGYLRKGHTVKGEMKEYNFEYDQIVSYGELFSSAILAEYLKSEGMDCTLLDVRDIIRTDFSYRNARVDWAATEKMIRMKIEPLISDEDKEGRIIITQGFIGSDPSLNTTTLGREGSDYTAAIFAYSLGAPEVTIWKDVPGVMNADPKWFTNAEKLESISFREAIELAYFGASVIHPKTIKPLENANISLRVKSFIDPEDQGTVITAMDKWKVPFPVFIRKMDQVLISISPRDFSFIIEENLSEIFSILARYGIRVNVMQNSAISFSVCVDDDAMLENHCIPALQQDFQVKYNKKLVLYTIRHYTQEAVDLITKDKKILLEQRTRNTIHLVTENV